MEGQVSATKHENTHDDNDHGHGPDPDFGSLVLPPARDPEHVLVVQIPKDQIYWVPPPENALIVERHRNPAKKAQRKRLCGCFSWCSVLSLCVVVFIFMAFFIMLTISPNTIGFVFLPRVPTFHIEHFSAKNMTSSGNRHAKAHLQYEITLKDENPNHLTGISYQEDGLASLLCRAREIATGRYAAFDQDGEETGKVRLTLEGLAVPLPEDIRKSMNSTKSKVHVPFSLEMDVPAKMKIGILKSGMFKFAVSCNFIVDTLEKKQVTRILSQKCNTKRQSL